MKVGFMKFRNIEIKVSNWDTRSSTNFTEMSLICIKDVFNIKCKKFKNCDPENIKTGERSSENEKKKSYKLNKKLWKWDLWSLEI